MNSIGRDFACDCASRINAASKVQSDVTGQLDFRLLGKRQIAVEPLLAGLEKFLAVPVLVVREDCIHGIAFGGAVPPSVHFFVR
jgi:hypothetical protein